MNWAITILLWTVYLVSLYFGVFWLITLLEHWPQISKKRTKKTNLKRSPQVSILIPVYNEEGTIADTIKSAANLHYPKDKLEIIVVNDGSTDHTSEIVKKELKRYPATNIRLLEQKNQGKAAALNHGVEEAQGEFFACLDADSRVEPQSLKKMLKDYEKNDSRLAIVTGVMQIRSPQTLLQWLQKIEFVVSQFLARLMSNIDCIYVAPGPFSLYRTSTIKKLGGFDGSTFTEDQEIGYRVQKHHFRMKQCPEAIVHTLAPKNVPALYKQRRRWLRGSLMNIIKYRHILFNKKYGDFGFFMVPLNLLTFFLSSAALLFFGYFALRPVFNKLYNYSLVGFDFSPYLKDLFNIKFNLIYMDLGRSLTLVLIIALSLILLYFAYKHSTDTLTKAKKLYIVPYLLLYYLLLSTIAVKVIFETLLRTRLKW